MPRPTKNLGEILGKSNAIECHVIACNAIEYHSIPSNTIEYHQILCKSMLMNLLPTFIDNGLIVGDNNSVLFNTCIYYSTHTNVLNYLLSNGFDPNIQNIDGDTPLIMSAIYNRTYNVKLLLEHNVDPFIKNNNGENVYDIVLQLERDYDFVNNGEYLNFCSENGVGFLSEYLYIYMIHS